MYGIVIGVLAAGLAMILWTGGALERFEARTWDWRVQKLARPSRFTDKIRIIFIDQNSLDWVKREMAYSWSWPRSLYQPILEYCRRQGAKAVAFDLLFTEPSAYSVEDDQTFAAAIASAPPFAATVFLGRDSGNATAWPTNVPALSLKISGSADWLGREVGERMSYPRASFPIPEIAAGAAMFGNVSARPDRDAIFRRLRLFNVFDGKAVPLLGLAAFLAASEDRTVALSGHTATIASRQIQLDRRGAAILNFRGRAGTHERIAASAVIQSELRLQEGKKPEVEIPSLKDCYVFLGCNAPGLLDLRPAPVGGVYTGVELHATMLDNFLAGDFMRDVPRGAACSLAVFLALLWGVVAVFGRGARDNVLALAAALPLPAVISVFAYTRGYWMPFMLPEAATVFALISAVLFNYATEGRQKRFIRGAFKQYLSEDVIEQLVAHPDRLSLGGEQRTLSIFFSDLQGFTGISEGLNPQELTSLLNEYLTAMTDIIQEEGGTVDKYEGDAIIAFWNAPLPQQDHAERAVRAALRCQSRLAQMRPALRQRTGKELFMRIGINSGPVVVGNMGSRNRFNYTILGDAANLASRLEGVNKQFGTYACISEATREAMGNNFAVRELARVAVVGRKAPVRIFEPMLPAEWQARREVLEQFARALQEFSRGRFAAALEIFEKNGRNDPASAAYARKCGQFINAPPPDWAGVWTVTEK